MKVAKANGVVVIAAMAGVLLLASAQAFAINPATWSFSLSTQGQDVSWTSPTHVDTGFPQYDFTYEITTLDAWVLGSPQSLLSLLGADASGAGSQGSLPIIFFDNETLSDTISGSSATLSLQIDAAGYGQASITDITLGTLFGFPITKLDVAGNISVTGVPEPGSLLLLALGGLAVLRRSRGQ